MKNRIIAGAVLLLAGLLLGFVPEYSRLVSAQGEIDSLRQQLDVSRRAEAMNSFRNRAALVYIETTQSNFTVALGMASKEFTDIRSFADGTADAKLKGELVSLLGARDAIVAGLARADPAAGLLVRELFLKMQKVE